MADMLLLPHELVWGGLPDCCVVCGAKHCKPVKQVFRVRVGESNYAVVKVHHLRVREGWMPLCRRHRRHFSAPTFALLGCAGAGFAFLFLTLMLSVLVRKVFAKPDAADLIAIASFVVGTVAGVLVGYFIRNRAVHELNVSDEGVHLPHLSEKFVEAVKLARQTRPKELEPGFALPAPPSQAPGRKSIPRTPLTIAIVAVMIPCLILTLVGGGLGATAVYKLVFWNKATAVHAWDETVMLTRGNDSRVMSRRHYSFTRKDGVSTNVSFLDDSYTPEKTIEIRYSPSSGYTAGLPYDSSHWDRESSVRVMLYAGLGVGFVGLLPCLIGGALLFFMRTGAAPPRRSTSPRRGRRPEDEEGGE